MKTRNLSLISLGLMLLLAGCASLESPFDRAAKAPTNKPLSSKTRASQLSHMESWTTRGSVSISYRGKTDIGSFVWHQRGLAYDFRTYGPLNSGSVRIEGRPGKATLWKDPRNPRTARSPEALMQQEVGWYLPLSNLRYWSRGLAAPGMPGRKRFDQYGHLAFLEQQGWAIDYQRYQAVGDRDLPRNIVMSHGELRVKIIFKEW